MNNDERSCPRCDTGRIKCSRCGGSGQPPRDGKPLWLYEQHSDKCADCVGAGSLSCPVCGGVCVVPA